MGLIIAAVAAAAISAAAYAGSSYMKHQGEMAALSAEQQAWMNVKDINIKDQQRLVSQADIDKYKGQFAAQEQVDPNAAALRKEGTAGVLNQLRQDQSGNTIADQSLKQSAALSSAESGPEKGVIDDLIARAKSDLESGATLPPEFQAELVRSGLAGSAQNGMALNGNGQAGVNTRTLLGGAGIQLQAQRTAEAEGAATTAGDIQSRRASILQGLAILDNDLRGAKTQRATGAAAFGYSATPDIGLSGKDVGNLSLANWKLDNQRVLALGGINANKALSTANANAAYVTAAGNFASSAVGSIAGGGAGAGGGGGGSSWIGGLLNSGGYGGSYGSVINNNAPANGTRGPI